MKAITSRLKTNRFDLIIFAAAGVLIVAAVLSRFLFDHRIALWAASPDANFDKFTGANLLKSLGKVYVPLWVLFLWGYLKNNLQLVLAACLSVLMALAVAGPLKLIVRRERPREVYMQQAFTPDGQQIRSNSDDQSFPSSDTAMVFAHAVVATPLLSLSSLPVLYVLAAAVGVLRILASAHYPSDVLAGAAIGIICGWLAIKLSKRWVSENKFRMTEWWKSVIYLSCFIIPVLTFFAGGIENVLVFFIASVLLAGALYLINRITAQSA